MSLYHRDDRVDIHFGDSVDEFAAAALDSETAHLKPGGAIAAGSKGARHSRGDGTVYGVETRARGPWQPYGDAGGASRMFPVFKYAGRAPASERPSYTKEDGTKVSHSTVKPLALMRWLVRLVTSAGDVVLDPFAGTGTTIQACLLEQRRCIAVEREADYLPLIMARLGGTP